MTGGVWSGRLAGAALALALGLGPALAEGLSADWEVLGTVEVEFDDGPATLYAARRIATGEATVMESEGPEGRVISIGAAMPDANGEPGVPILTLKLGPYRGGIPLTVALDLREADRVLMAGGDSEAKAAITRIRLTPAGELSFDFTADLVVMAPSADGTHAPLAGAVGERIEGRFEGRLPDR
jgi:hypothetical protein